MSRRRSLLLVGAFAAWTLLVWSTRFGTIWSDDSLDTAGKLDRTALAGSFTVLAAVTLVCVFRARRRGFGPRAIYLVGAFALWTVVVWAVRIVGIANGDHSAAFVAVHAVLAVVSVVLAVAAVHAVRAVRRSAEGDVEGERQAATPAAGLEELVDG